MHFKVYDYVTQVGEGICNEDVAGVRDNLAWVIDGATDVCPTSFFADVTEAKWLVDRLDEQLHRAELVFSSADLSAEFGRLAQYVDAELARSAYPQDRLPPACSCGMARIDPEHGVVELALVGDVYLFAVTNRELLSNSFFSKRESVGVRQARARKGGPNLVLHDRDQIAARRRGYISGADDHFVLSNNPDVSRGVIAKSLPVRAGDMLLLCTDGFARLIEGYGIYRSWSTLASAAVQHGLSALMQELRAYESKHRRSEHNYKASDDACAILISVEENS